MNPTNEKSQSQLTTDLESIAIAVLSKKYGTHDKGLGFSIVVLANEMQKGTFRGLW